MTCLVCKHLLGKDLSSSPIVLSSLPQQPIVEETDGIGEALLIMDEL